MSSVFKRSGSWYLRWKDAAGVWRQEVSAVRTRDEAKKLAAELELKHERIRRGTEVEPGDPTLTFARLFAWWEETHGPELAVSTRDTKLRAMRKHLLPKLGPLLLREVTSARLEVLFDELGQVLAGSSVNGHRGMLHAIFARAAKRGLWIGSNPVVATEKRKETSAEFDEISAEEVPLLLRAVSDRWRPLVATAIFTAARKGELGALRRTDVDLAAGLITFGRSWARNTTKGGSTKSVPIAAALRPYLEEALERSKGSQLLFPRPDGTMMRADTKLAVMLRRAMARAGLTRGWMHVCRRTSPKRCGFSEQRDHNRAEPCPQCGFRLWPKPIHRPVRFHDTRATTATLLARSGATPAVAQRVLRHSDPRLTLKTYTRVNAEEMKRALDAMLPSMLPAAPVPEPEALPIAAAVNADSLAVPVLHRLGAASGRTASELETSALLGASGRAGKGIRTLDPCLGKATPGSVNVAAPRAPAMNRVPSRGVPDVRTESDARRSSQFIEPLAAQVLHGGFRATGGRGSVPTAIAAGRPVSAAPAAFLTVRQVAAQLAVSTATVYALIERGELAHVRVSNAIRVSPTALEAYLGRGRR